MTLPYRYGWLFGAPNSNLSSHTAVGDLISSLCDVLIDFYFGLCDNT